MPTARFSPPTITGKRPPIIPRFLQLGWPPVTLAKPPFFSHLAPVNSRLLFAARDPPREWRCSKCICSIELALACASENARRNYGRIDSLLPRLFGSIRAGKFEPPRGGISVTAGDPVEACTRPTPLRHAS